MSNAVKKGAPRKPKTPDGDQGRPSNDPDVARQKLLAEEIMRDDREVLRKLAE